mmetsp:Transcript_15012/g.31136  ORF Transcript_15012/g.31136 Transcript_15012/m.31136 type:complete len:210 (+) Transcript_15012:713-1342(+)
MPTHQYLVVPLDFARSKYRVQVPQRVHRFGKHHQPRRVHAQPVDDHLVQACLLVGDVFKHGLRQRRYAFLAGDAQDTRWFVDANNVFVLVDNDQFRGKNCSGLAISCPQFVQLFDIPYPNFFACEFGSRKLAFSRKTVASMDRRLRTKGCGGREQHCCRTTTQSNRILLSAGHCLLCVVPGKSTQLGKGVLTNCCNSVCCCYWIRCNVI